MVKPNGRLLQKVKEIKPVIKQDAGSLCLFFAQRRADWRLDESRLTWSPEGRWWWDTRHATLIDGRTETVPKLAGFGLVSLGTARSFAFLDMETPVTDKLTRQSAQEANRNVLLEPG